PSDLPTCRPYRALLRTAWIRGSASTAPSPTEGDADDDYHTALTAPPGTAPSQAQGAVSVARTVQGARRAPAPDYRPRRPHVDPDPVRSRRSRQRARGPDSGRPLERARGPHPGRPAGAGRAECPDGTPGAGRPPGARTGRARGPARARAGGTAGRFRTPPVGPGPHQEP